jgi:hypothetical protein
MNAWSSSLEHQMNCAWVYGWPEPTHDNHIAID